MNRDKDKTSIRITRMELSDLQGALRVERACFTEAWSEAVYHATLLLPYTRYLAARSDDGEIVGTIGLRLIAGEGEITNVAVLPDWQGRGIGSLLLQEALRTGLENGAEAFTLEVRASNRAAITVYERQGFVTEGVRRSFYTGPTEDALIMWKRTQEEGVS